MPKSLTDITLPTAATDATDASSISHIRANRAGDLLARMARPEGQKTPLYAVDSTPDAHLPTGTLVSTIPRWAANGANVVGTSGVLKLSLIFLDAGTLVSNIILTAASTGGATLTHSLAGLYTTDAAPVRLATSADNTGATWTTLTTRTFAMTTPYLVTVSGYYYIGAMVAGTTLPTFYVQSAAAGLGLVNRPPITGATSSTGLTTSLPNPAAALTAVVNQFYAEVS